MKKILFTFALMLTTMCVTAQDNDIALSSIYQKFAFTLFNKVIDNKEDGNMNIILSPLSAQMALSMMQNGAAGNTLAEIQQVLGTTAFSTEQVNEYNRKVVEKLTPSVSVNKDEDGNNMDEDVSNEASDISHPICELANGTWAKPGITLYDSFKEKLATYYDAEAGTVDFGTQEGIDIINRWANEKTHGLIPGIYDEPDPYLLVVLTNALYFKGNWTVPFNSNNTKAKKFYLIDGQTIDVDMMRLFYESFNISKSDKFHTVTLPYGAKGDFTMTIFLPTDKQDFPSLTYEDWTYANKTSKRTLLNLQMPKFSIDGHHLLTNILQGLGMVEAFTPMANFSLVSPDPLLISKVFQLAKIIVDEEGTEAAALTVMEEIETSTGDEENPEDFIIDHPFYFTIENKSTQTILFMGQVLTIDGSSAPSNDVEAYLTVSQDGNTGMVTPGNTTELILDLHNAMEEITGLQCDIILPEGLAIMKENDNFIYSLCERCNGMQAQIVEVARNHYSLMVFPMNNNTVIEGTSGAVINLTLKADPSMVEGDYEGMLRNIVLTNLENNITQPTTTAFTITVTRHPSGDVNHDGYVNVVDVMTTVNYVLTRNVPNFHIENADINNDGSTDISDVMGIVNIVLYTPTETHGLQGQ